MLHCQPPVPSRETASPVDLEGTERTKDGGVASTRVRGELGSADSVFTDTETFEGTRKFLLWGHGSLVATLGHQQDEKSEKAI